MKRKTFVNGLFVTATSFALIAGVLVYSPAETVKAAEVDSPGSSAVYRLYNPDNGEHLYTTDANERNVLFNDYGWGYEGVAWYSPNAGTPVYRLYNSVLCNHLYTCYQSEVDALTEDWAWTVDNNGEPLFYSGESWQTGIPIYRVYNEDLQGMHHLTTDKNEYAVLPKYGWEQEGASLFALSEGSQIQTLYSDGGNKISEITPNDFPYDLYTVMDVKAENGKDATGFYYIREYSPLYWYVDNKDYWGCDHKMEKMAAEKTGSYNYTREGSYLVGIYDDWGEVYCRYIY